MTGKFAKVDIRYILFSLFASGFLVAPLLYIDHRKDREQFVSISWLPGKMAIDALILAMLALVFAAIIYLFLTRVPKFLSKERAKEPLPKLSLRFRRRDILVTTAIIFAFWVPVMVLMYPCASNHDFINQVYQYQASAPTYYTTLGITIDAEFIDHHPIFDTLVYGWFMSLGDMLGSQNVGMFIFSIVQSALIALTLSTSVCYLDKLQLPKCIRITALAFAIFFPYYSWFAAIAMKDTLFILGFTPFCLCYLEAFRSKGEALRDKRFLVSFILITGLCIITKKLGIYICSASILVMIIALAGVRTRSCVMLVAPILVFSLALPAVVYPMIGGVAPGGKQESICFALQQTTSLLIHKPKAVSDEDLATIEKVLDTKAAKEDFKEALADGAKNHWRPEATTADELNYLKVWVKEGIQNPKSYIMTQAKCTGQMLIPSKQITYQIDISDKEHLNNWGAEFNAVSEGYHMKLHRPDFLLDKARLLRNALQNGIGKIPVLGLITTIGFYGGWLPFLCCAITFVGRKKNVLALAPVMLSVCTLLISPGSLGRYVISIMFVLIPMIGWMLYSLTKNKQEHASD